MCPQSHKGPARKKVLATLSETSYRWKGQNPSPALTIKQTDGQCYSGSHNYCPSEAFIMVLNFVANIDADIYDVGNLSQILTSIFATW